MRFPDVLSHVGLLNLDRLLAPSELLLCAEELLDEVGLVAGG